MSKIIKKAPPKTVREPEPRNNKSERQLLKTTNIKTKHLEEEEKKEEDEKNKST